jgi:hypothetical protein
VLNLLLNDPTLLRAVERLAGEDSVRSFSGSLRRAIAGKALGWHDDNVDGRSLAITINLGRRPYRGGVFELRVKRSRRVIAQIANTVPGDALLFRVGSRLEHRNTAITSSIPKTALSGWFLSRRPPLQSLGRSRSSLGPAGEEPGQTDGGGVDLAATLSTSQTTASRRLGPGTVLFNILTGVTFELNATGSLVWHMVMAQHSGRSITARLASEYDAPASQIERDVRRLLSVLDRRQLIDARPLQG